VKAIPKQPDQFFVPLLLNTKDKWQVIAMVDNELYFFDSNGTKKHYKDVQQLKPFKNQTTI